MINRLRQSWNKWVLLGAVFVACSLCLFFGGLSVILSSTQLQQQVPTAAMTVLHAPSPTAVMSQTPEGGDGKIAVVDGISIGSYVQISGTDGAGLRIRSSPGTDNDVHFIALDEEVFEVDDGPVEKDGYTWWHLVASYDENRNGWAVSSYLKFVAQKP
jgi:hypothetical protein